MPTVTSPYKWLPVISNIKTDKQWTELTVRLANKGQTRIRLIIDRLKPTNYLIFDVSMLWRRPCYGGVHIIEVSKGSILLGYIIVNELNDAIQLLLVWAQVNSLCFVSGAWKWSWEGCGVTQLITSEIGLPPNSLWLRKLTASSSKVWPLDKFVHFLGVGYAVGLQENQLISVFTLSSFLDACLNDDWIISSSPQNHTKYL